MALVTRCPITSSQKILVEALRACKNKSGFALEQLERAVHMAAQMGVAKSCEVYNLGKEYLVTHPLCYLCSAKKTFFVRFTAQPLV